MATTKSRKNTEKAEPFALPTVPSSLGEVTNGDEARAWFEDNVVRQVREQGYCAQALTVMDAVFGGPKPENLVYDARGVYGSDDGSRSAGNLYPAYVDSDGFDCWRNQWRDLETGLDRNGLDEYGRDADGYDKDGYDRAGFNREGVDREGVSRDNPSRYRFNVHGRDAEGYDREGYDRQGFNREGVDRAGRKRPEPNVDEFVFDKNGYDRDGYDMHGYRLDGSYDGDVSRKYRALSRRL